MRMARFKTTRGFRIAVTPELLWVTVVQGKVQLWDRATADQEGCADPWELACTFEHAVAEINAAMRDEMKGKAR